MLLRLQALAICPPHLSGRLSVESSTERAPEQPQPSAHTRAAPKGKSSRGAPRL
jgi:hypothetical protein